MKILFFGIVLLLCADFTQQSFRDKLVVNAIELTKHHVVYDAAYFQISYPNGDIPADKGVCTDVVIRAYRKVGVDLQQLVHEDMKNNFGKYPNLWGLTKPDTNIDHRRVPNLMKFFSDHGLSLSTQRTPEEYKPGDIIAWSLGGGLTHIGIVINRKSGDGRRFLVVHNIGRGQEISDCLFSYAIIGHYRYPAE
jgi:uncharacterized protein